MSKYLRMIFKMAAEGRQDQSFDWKNWEGFFPYWQNAPQEVRGYWKKLLKDVA